MEGEQHESMREREHPPPKIYAACLAAYNNGYLHGDWIYADQEPEDLHAEILDILDRSPISGSEEWAIHDYDGFGAFNLHEYEDLSTVSTVAKGIALHGPVFAHWVQEVGTDTDDVYESFDAASRGSFDSYSDVAEQFLDDMGFNPRDILPDWISGFVSIDLDGIGRHISSDYVAAEDDDGIHLFDTG